MIARQDEEATLLSEHHSSANLMVFDDFHWTCGKFPLTSPPYAPGPSGHTDYYYYFMDSLYNQPTLAPYVDEVLPESAFSAYHAQLAELENPYLSLLPLFLRPVVNDVP